MLKLLLIGILIYVTVIWSFEAEISGKKHGYKITYNGLLWLLLDFYSIWKYKSKDKVINWLKIEKI